MAIGQGETTMSPLQLALAYSAPFNGGKICEPTLGWAVVGRQRQGRQDDHAQGHSEVPVAASTFNYIANSLNFSARLGGVGRLRLHRLALSQPDRRQDRNGRGVRQAGHLLARHVGAAVSTNKAGNVTAKFVIVGMVEQAGTGATAAGPMLKRIWDGILGVSGKPIVANSAPIKNAAEDPAAGEDDAVRTTP